MPIRLTNEKYYRNNPEINWSKNEAHTHTREQETEEKTHAHAQWEQKHTLSSL